MVTILRNEFGFDVNTAIPEQMKNMYINLRDRGAHVLNWLKAKGKHE